MRSELRKLHVHLTARLGIAAAVVIAFAVSPALAQAQAPGSLAQLGGSDSCIAAGESECPTTNGDGLSGSGDVAVSPDGQNVYVLGQNDDAIAEFTRNTDGSLSQIGCIADIHADGTCDSTSADGLVGPEAIAISPNGDNVYVAARDDDGNDDIAEFSVNDDGSLTELGCIAESSDTSNCESHNASGLQEVAVALAISPDGDNLYAADEDGEAIAEFAVNSDGTLSQLSETPCIQDANADSEECGSTANGISEVNGIVVSPDGQSVYTSGFVNDDNEDGTIAELTRNSDGSLSQDDPVDCVEDPALEDEGCGSTAVGIDGISQPVMSPDGKNLYTASQFIGGPIAEFAVNSDGSLSQLAAPNDCIEETDSDLGCGTEGQGIASGWELAMSPDGENVYAAAPDDECGGSSHCEDVAEFTRNADGTLTQLASPDNCIQDQGAEGEECDNENGLGLGGQGVAISSDGTSVYVTGQNDVAEFARTPPATVTISLAGAGSGAVSDGTGAITCPTACSHTYAAGSQITLTPIASSGSAFAGWSGGGCSGTGTCQLTLSPDTATTHTAVTATFNSAPAQPTPGSPTPVLTGAPGAVTDAGAGFSGSVNPDGLPTTAYFQYGLDKRYSQVGASGANYTAQTQSQVVGSDFTTHGVGPVTVTGLVPNALYHVRLVATNSAGTTVGQDVTFTTALAPAPGAPTLGATFNIEPVSGLVLVFIHGHLVPLTQLTQIPSGVPIDTLHGTLKLITATGGGGTAHDAAAKTQTGEFSGAVFRLSQQTRGAGKGLVTLMMALSAFKGGPSQAICRNNGAAADAHAAKANSKVIQLLHASAHGKFRTSGRYSAATVLGTIWTVTARCDGTVTHAIKDEVEVTDFVRHKTIILHAGQSYLAPGRGKGG
jgi:hypothetical protein